MGIVHHFFKEDEFTNEGDFVWKKLKVEDKTIVYLGCKFSIWGNIAGVVAKYLCNNKAKCIIYIGKLGTLKKNITPNDSLCSGSCSFVDNKLLIWKNLFDDIKDYKIVYGKHITLPSVMMETKAWLHKNQDEFDFVDPEIGCIAKNCLANKVTFSYLHIVSDNLHHNYAEDLSNERSIKVVQKRKILYNNIKQILKSKKLME